MTDMDRIEKKSVLKAPRSRMSRALTDAKEFGTWFRVKLDADFGPGKRVVGRITYPSYEHLGLELLVERMDPDRPRFHRPPR